MSNPSRVTLGSFAPTRLDRVGNRSTVAAICTVYTCVRVCVCVCVHVCACVRACVCVCMHVCGVQAKE